MANPLILALDVGTSSVRAMLFDAAGGLLPGSQARRAVPLEVRPDGAAEVDAPELLERTWTCVDETLARAASRARDILGVAVTTLVGNVVVVDGQGRPASKLMTYADTRPAGEVRALRAALDEADAHERTGCHFHPGYLPARILWARREQPEWLRPGMRWLTLGEWMALQLFGQAAVSYSAASWSGLLDRRALAWDARLLDFLGAPDGLLSPLVDVHMPWRGLAAPFAARWPALRALPWFPAVGDGAAANIGSGCLDAGRVCVSVGTSSAVRATLTHIPPEVPRGLWCYRVDARRPLLGGALSEGGNIFAWLKGALQLESGEALDARLGAMPADGHGLTFLPLLAGERSPGWEGGRRGALHGLTLATTPLDILRAGMEGVACRLGLIYDLLRPALAGEPEVIASGGATRQRAWAQIIADALGRPLAIAPDEEASARGAALLALEALGAPHQARPDSPAEWITPDPARHAVYLRARQRQQQLYAQLAGLDA